MEYLGEGNAPKRAVSGIPDLQKLSTLEQLEKEGYKAFSAAPIHCYAGVAPGELSERFAAEHIKKRPEDVRGGFLETAHPTVMQCGKLGYRLEVMDLASYAFFKLWMMAQVWVRRDVKRVYISRLIPSPLLDPLGIAHGLAIPTSLDVFAVSGSRAFMRPCGWLNNREDAKMYVTFESSPPEPNVVQLQKEVFLGV